MKRNNKQIERYNKYVEAVTPQSGFASSLFHSFWIGGLTCLIGQALHDIYAAIFPELGKDFVSNITLMTLVTLAIILTGFGVYDLMALKGGAGTFLPITGFANAMASASMEFKCEGMIMGTSVKMFTVVGPVIVNGLVWSTVAGIIRLIISGLFG